MERLAVGLMSGTSLDGIDAALVKIEGYGLNTRAELISFISEPFTERMKRRLRDCMDLDASDTRLICSINFELGALFAEAVKKVCQEAGMPLGNVDFIGSHGQTIFHWPREKQGYVKSTLQIGEPAVIAFETGIPVISDFRSMDMAAGGEGAPLVPYTDYLLYRSESKGRALQNIGGIGNVTILPKRGTLEDVYAFDTGPGNMIIDELCMQLKGAPYDRNGCWAAEGKVQKGLAEEWLKMGFFREPPPKSTGRELFGARYTERLLERYSDVPDNDLIATATYFTALSIADAMDRFVFPVTKIDELIIGGGGSYNRTLLSMLRELLPGISILTQEDIGYSSEAKEAIAFAVLANETLHQQPSNAMKATGAKESVVLGSITQSPRQRSSKQMRLEF